MIEYDKTAELCDAEESDWLDVSYSERKYVKSKSKKLKGVWKFAIVAVVCVALLTTMLLLDGDFKKDVFQAVKTATATVFGKKEKVENTINIPCNLTLVNVEEGVMTFCGGRAALSLTAGKVTDVTEDSVTVAIDEKTSVVYSGLTSVFVSANDTVESDMLLGKYEGRFTASILQNGEVVKQVVGSETQLKWNI